MQNKIKKVAFYTLGCKLNFAETSTISRFFITENFKIVKFNEFADFYVINSCSVTSNADKKSRNSISKALHINPDAVIIVTGCYAQLNTDEIKKTFGVDYIFGVNNKDEIRKIIHNFKKNEVPDIITTDHKEMKTFFPAFSKGDRTRSFLKVQDGCDYFCSYCTIPYARGRSRNQPVTEIISNARNIVDDGIKEIIISGVNIGDFGKTTGESFQELLCSLSDIEGLERFRIGSIEPNLLSDEIIDFAATNKKFMPHFHIPLQSGSDTILKLMNRKYDTHLFRYKIEKIKGVMPYAFIGIDLIVGVNGETEEHFEETVKFVNSLDISFIHHFQYSERKNTKALNFKPKVTSQQKQERSKVIKDISDKKHYNFLKDNIGKEFYVLFESTRKGNKIFGYTDNYIKVEYNYDKDLINKIVKVKLTGFADSETLTVQIL
ncbi:MAG: tRNA (N(6)-L-threonylcarbamoyladenosine(37)-C(2))-methylthiotransferase MtaB [Bacteroidales bacterium]|jgi:threonylcarbamoyladenosine tRNA methylthiotransferase MtaB|nr:tRNA (N(6)-L-threonylcarbamoyladenosine(37)-C(2))-methylthiotransferase MtaB [Bacteroidales bacterium]